MQRLVRKLFLLHAVGDLTWVALLFSMIMIYREEPQVIPGSYLPALVVYVLLVCCFLLTGLRIPVQVSRFVLFDHILLIGQIISYIGLVLLIHHPLVFIVSMLFTPILSQWCLRNACAMIIGSGALVTMIAWLLWPLNWHAVFGLAVISPQLFLMYFVRILLHEGNVQQELEEKNLELQATQDLLLQIAAQDERIRISRDMHDVIGHGLTGLSIQTELLTLETTGNLKEKLQLLHDNARQLLADVRETVSFIRQPRNYDLKSILTRMVEGILRPSARLEMNNVNINQPHHAEALLRCVQEGTTNAIRHSKAETILISLTGCSEAIQLIIRDDGCGMETDECKFGNGLNGIRERISALNGEFKLYSRKNQGTTIDITLPLRAEL